MRTVLVSQRVEVVESYRERRDCLDQRWCGFLAACGCLPVPVMNGGMDVETLICEVRPSGILLTGGNDLEKYGGTAPERDETERRLITAGIRHGIPVIGVCRGMQMLADHFGGALVPVSGHVAQRHMLLGGVSREVNSYHGFGLREPPKDFEVLARAEDGVIEALQSRTERVLGIMWHPEREEPFDSRDVRLFTDFFCGGEQS